MLNKSIKITKKVIIINQKTELISENFNIQNKEPQLNFQIDKQLDRNNSNYIDSSKQLQNSQQQQYQIEIEKQQQLQKMKELSNIYNGKIKQIKEVIQELKKRTKELEGKLKKGQKNDKCKRNRRLSSEVEKQYQCKVQDCEREYGSIVSLRLHERLKHKK